MPQTTYGVVDLASLLGEDGLTFLKGMLDGSRPHPPIAETIGFHLVDVSEGGVVFEAVPRYEHYNPIDTVHAGFAATLLDSALACAIWSTAKVGEGWTTLELKLNLVRALTDQTGPVPAEGRVLHRGRNVATSEAHLMDSSGRLYAHATSTCMIFPAKG